MIVKYDKYGIIIPGGAGGIESRRKHAFFSSSCRIGESRYISGMRADAPIEVAVDVEKAVASGVDFILTDSDAILTSQHVPNTVLLWVVDDKLGTARDRRQGGGTKRVGHGRIARFEFLSSTFVEAGNWC